MRFLDTDAYTDWKLFPHECLFCIGAPLHVVFWLPPQYTGTTFDGELNDFVTHIWRARTTPILEKTLRECRGQMKIFRVGSRQFRESLRELLRELWVWYRSSRERPFREWNVVFREWNFQFWELLREYPGTLRELREWPFHSESVFPEIGLVPRLLNI